MSNIQYNDDQIEVIAAVSALIADPAPRIPHITVDGSAGVGKSTCIWGAILDNPNKRYYITAPKHKAVKVLRKMGMQYLPREVYDRVIFTTCYSALGLPLTDDSPKREVRPRKGHVFDRTVCDVIWIDEAGTIPLKVAEYLEQVALRTGVKFIFTEDPCQTPPVGEEHSIVSEWEPKLNLTKVMRHDNQILSLATQLRDRILAKDYSDPCSMLVSNNSGGEGVFVIPSSSVGATMSKAFNSDTYKNDSDTFKVLAWTNAAVDKYNRVIRAGLYGPEAYDNDYFVGERVIAKGRIHSSLFDLTQDPSMNTDEEGTVVHIEQEFHPLFDKVLCHKLIIEPEFGASTAIAYVPKGNAGTYEMDKILNTLKESARADGSWWPDYWRAVDVFHKVAPAHAITVHRAQGSTYNTVFVDVGNIMNFGNVRGGEAELERRRLEAFRILYTACTRPSKQLILIR